MNRLVLPVFTKVNRLEMAWKPILKSSNEWIGLHSLKRFETALKPLLYSSYRMDRFNPLQSLETAEERLLQASCDIV